MYYPFAQSIRDNGRVAVTSPLVEQDGRYAMDFDGLERQIAHRRVRLMLLCSPHNPVGRVWSREELMRLGDICIRHDVRVVSDEIHGDLIYPGHRQLVFASLGPELSRRTVTCTSPSKTFNLVGLQISNIFISDPELRRRFQAGLDAAGYSQPNQMGLVACEAAYRAGGPWLGRLMRYLAENWKMAEDFLSERLPRVRLIRPEGTYLLWLDFRRLGLTAEELENRLLRRARLWLDSGPMFGPEGAGFARMNIACPRSVLRRALRQLEAAVTAE